MTTQFDPHAIIRELAKAESLCLFCNGVGFVSDSGPYFHDRHSCERCGGKGRIVPFESLRVRCLGICGHPLPPPFDMCGYMDCDSHDRSERIHPPDGDYECECGGREWIPEPNQRAAMWEILQALPKKTQLVIIQRGLDQQTCLTEAQQWLESML